MSIITTDLQLISTATQAEGIGGWTQIGATTAWSATSGVDSDAKVQGASCLKNPSLAVVYPSDLGFALNTTTNAATPLRAWDYSNKLLFFWRNHTIPTNLPYKSQLGGNAVWMSTSATYVVPNLTGITANNVGYKVWDLTGSDNDQVGGWNSFAIDPTRTANLSSGTLNVTAIQSYAFTRKYLTSVTSPFDFLDVVRIGTGLKVKDNSAVTGQSSSFLELFNLDQSASTAYGVITKNNGIYNIVGKIIVGGTDAGFTSTNFASAYYASTITNVDSQQSLTYFQDNDETVVFKTLPVTTSAFEIRVATTGVNHTVFQLGNYDFVNSLASGDVTIRGNIDNGALSSQQETPVALTTIPMFTTFAANSAINRVAQTFLCTAIGSKLKSVQFWLSRTGSPTGSVVARLYTSTGTGVPLVSTATGIALSTSSAIVATSLSTTPGYYTFNFIGNNQYALQDGVYYAIALELTGNTSGSGAVVNAYRTTSVIPGRNLSTSTNTSALVFLPQGTQSLVHKLYTTNQAATWRLNAVNPPAVTATATNGNNIIKLYSAYLANAYSTVLNGNTRSITTGCVITANSTQLTTSSAVTRNAFTASNIVPNMLITGYGIPAATYVTSIDDDYTITMGNTATISVATTSVTFTDRSEVISCTWKDFGTITPNGCYIYDSIFQNLNTSTLVNATHAMVINQPSELANISQCKFINAGRAIRIRNPGVYTLTNVTFSGSTYDIDNASSGQVVINAYSGSNPKTYINSAGGTTVINIFRTFNITNVISSSTVRIVRASDLSVLAAVDNIGPNYTITTGTSTSSSVSVYTDPINIGNYVMSYTYGYTVDIPVYVVVFALGYQALRPGYTLQNADATYQAGQVIDRQYYNPGGIGA